MIKNKVNDHEIRVAGEELYEKILESLAKLGVHDEKMNTGENHAEDEDSGYETVSYEEASDDDEEMNN
jgi:hypothetical protein